jgi:hypothetical protein
MVINEVKSLYLVLLTLVRKLSYLPQLKLIANQFQKLYKGKATGKTIVIYTARQGSACGYALFKVGETFLIYGSSHSYLYAWIPTSHKARKGLEKKHPYWTNHCTRTTDDCQQEIKQLKRLK